MSGVGLHKSFPFKREPMLSFPRPRRFVLNPTLSTGSVDCPVY
jgi:hypothetical protein